jgi:hypothetical protein
MAQEQTPATKAGADQLKSTADGQNASLSESAEVPRESKTKSILRDAIHKVMEEIEHHEAEAQRHLKQAADLRKDLRESIAYLQEQGEKGARTGVTGRKAATQDMNDKTKDSAPRRKPAKRR